MLPIRLNACQEKVLIDVAQEHFDEVSREHLEFSTQTENSRSLDIIWNTSIYVQDCELGIVVIQISATYSGYSSLPLSSAGKGSS